MLTVSFIYRAIRTNNYNEFQSVIQEKACEYAKKEKITKSICQEYPSYCKAYFKTLIEHGYIEEDLINPGNNLKVVDDKTNYVEFTWDDNIVTCTYKEG